MAHPFSAGASFCGTTGDAARFDPAEPIAASTHGVVKMPVSVGATSVGVKRPESPSRLRPALHRTTERIRLHIGGFLVGPASVGRTRWASEWCNRAHRRSGPRQRARRSAETELNRSRSRAPTRGPHLARPTDRNRVSAVARLDRRNARSNACPGPLRRGVEADRSSDRSSVWDPMDLGARGPCDGRGLLIAVGRLHPLTACRSERGGRWGSRPDRSEPIKPTAARFASPGLGGRIVDVKTNTHPVSTKWTLCFQDWGSTPPRRNRPPSQPDDTSRISKPEGLIELGRRKPIPVPSRSRHLFRHRRKPSFTRSNLFRLFGR